MISSLLADTSNLLSKVSIVQNILENGYACSLLTAHDHSHIMLLVADTLSSELPQAIAYNLICQVIVSCIPDSNGTLYNSIEKLTSYIDSVDSDETCSAIARLLTTLYSTSNESIRAQMEKTHVKLVTSTLRLFKSPGTACFGYSLMHAIALNKHHPLQPSAIAAVKEVCISHVSSACFQRDAAAVLGSLFSSAAGEVWAVQWAHLSNEAAVCVVSLGIDVEGAAATATTAKLIGHSDTNINGKPNSKGKSNKGSANQPEPTVGIDKALMLAAAFNGMSLALAELLKHGNSSSFISFDVGLFLRTCSALLLHRSSPLTGGMHIDNLAHISPSALLAVVPDMQISCLRTLISLIRTAHGSLLRASPAMVKLVSSALLTATTAVNTHPSLVNSCVDALALCVRAYPSLIAQGAALGVNQLIHVFGQLVMEASASPLSLVSRDERNPLHALDPSVVLSAMDQLVLYCGYSLTSEQLTSIESILNTALVAMLRGVFNTRQTRTRKMLRVACESLREDPYMQSLVLQTSCSFVLACHRNGMVSGLIPLLKRCCEGCSVNEATQTAAVRVLTVLDAMLVPCAVVIPVSTIQVAIQEEVRNVRSKRVEDSPSMLAEPVVAACDEEEEEEESAPAAKRSRAASMSLIVKSSQQRANTKEQLPSGQASGQALERESGRAEAVAKSRSKIETMFTRESRSALHGSVVETSADSDDESIPEIHM